MYNLNYPTTRNQNLDISFLTSDNSFSPSFKKLLINKKKKLEFQNSGFIWSRAQTALESESCISFARISN